MLDKDDISDVKFFVNYLIKNNKVKCVDCESSSVEMLKINEQGPVIGTEMGSGLRVYFMCSKCGNVFSCRPGGDLLPTVNHMLSFNPKVNK